MVIKSESNYFLHRGDEIVSRAIGQRIGDICRSHCDAQLATLLPLSQPVIIIIRKNNGDFTHQPLEDSLFPKSIAQCVPETRSAAKPLRMNQPENGESVPILCDTNLGW